jgi:hypothetical protein
VHPAATRPHLDIFLPHPYFTSTVGIPSLSSSKFSTAAAISHASPSLDILSTSLNSPPLAAASGVAFQHPDPRSCAKALSPDSIVHNIISSTVHPEDSRAEVTTAHMLPPDAAHNTCLTHLSLLATIIEYSCPALKQYPKSQQVQEQEQEQEQELEQEHHQLELQPRELQHQQLQEPSRKKKDTYIAQFKSQPASSAVSGDWGLATQILLRKTRTDCSRTLLRRHCSRHLHAVVLHWRLASIRVLSTDLCRHNTASVSHIFDEGYGGCCSDKVGVISTASEPSIMRRVTWDDQTAPKRIVQGVSHDHVGGTKKHASSRIEVISINRDSVSLSAAWKENFAAAAAVLTSNSSGCC